MILTPMSQAEGVALELEYYTEVQRSDNGTEKRAMYRDIPMRRLETKPLTLEAWRSGWLDSLLYGGFAELVTVPYWPHMARLTAPAAPGTGVALALDTTDRDFAVGGRLVLWTDERTAEECVITAAGGASVTVQTLAGTWAAGTPVMPAWRGHYSADPGPEHLSAYAVEVALKFEMEIDPYDTGIDAATDPEVFGAVPVNRVETVHTHERAVDRHLSPFYTHDDYRRRNSPFGSRPYVLWIESKADAAAVTAWFHARRGRLKPFWMPTFEQDLAVVSGLGTTSIIVEERGYTEWMTARARRQLAFCEPDGTVTALEVTGAADNGNGTETLSLSGTAPLGTSLVSFLLYGRLASDVLRIEWYNSEQASCEIGLVELPEEVVPPGIAPFPGSLDWAGFAPTMGLPPVAAPGQGILGWQGFAPTIGLASPAPVIGELEYEGFAPELFMGLTVAPLLGVMNYTGFAPLVVPSVMPLPGVYTYSSRRPRVKTT